MWWLAAAHPVSGTPEARGLQARPLQTQGPGYNCFDYLLLQSERDRLENYCSRWWAKQGTPPEVDMDCFVHLGDNPDERVCWSASMRLPTLRRSMGLIYHPATRTILTGRERLCAQGWPVMPDQASAAGFWCDFPDPARAAEYAGNGFHIPTYGIWLAVCLACVRLTEPDSH